MKNGSRDNSRRNAPINHYRLFRGEIMKLSYRGISYDHKPAVLEIQEGEVTGKFRGKTWKAHTVKGISAPKRQARMTYRGVVI